eukprot:TRINITY_DN2369_c1_g1_i1.p1 TRINITY_DN2369_c1_g1~~TRINITY_DN2369_c1_g1_i1.p1  ORF type:complete len:199 (-),score=68.22 TRINITY_DN2369_c1_g1_i1:115-711(-)
MGNKDSKGEKKGSKKDDQQRSSNEDKKDVKKKEEKIQEEKPVEKKEPKEDVKIKDEKKDKAEEKPEEKETPKQKQEEKEDSDSSSESDSEASKESASSKRRDPIPDIQVDAKELFASIPDEVKEKTKDWKVKNAAILKSATIQETSKVHPFNPPVDLSVALDWVASNGGQDAALIFTDESSIRFTAAKFEEFEDMSDD